VQRRGDNVVVQHILLKPNVLSSDIKLAMDKADSVRSLIVAEKMSFGEAVTKFSDDPNAKFTGGMIQNPMTGSNFITIDMLDDPSTKDLVMILNDLKPGGISKPEVFEDEQGRKAIRMVYLKTKTEPHRENLQDDYARIQQRTMMGKQSQALSKWLIDKSPTFYIHVEPEYRNCENIQNWTGNNVASKN
jgi:peptidyl-prolyl cis-trans isomerase SurA